MANLTTYQYYSDEANFGSYQYITLRDLVNNFMLMFTGNHSVINNEDRYKIIFHAKNAIKELNYDAVKDIKTLELTVASNLRFVLPPDFVNLVKIYLSKNGALRPLNNSRIPMTARTYFQDDNGDAMFDEAGELLTPENSDLDFERLQGTAKTMYLNQNSPFNGEYGYYFNGNWYFDFSMGRRFGLETSLANLNPVYSIDRRTGVINFSSDMAEETCIIEYVSDGMENGNEADVSINKMFEQYIYAYIEYNLLNSKRGVQEYVIARARKHKMALLRNARIRISNIKPSDLRMVLRGNDKWLK